MALEDRLGISDSAELAREIYMKGIDASYYYEGYNAYKSVEL